MSQSDTQDKYSIALLIETSSSYGRQILRGIQRFIQEKEKQDWIAVIEERDVNAGVPDWIKNWSGDGIISRQTTEELQLEVTNRELAFVELTDRDELTGFTKVRSDDHAIGAMAAEHFQERGLQNFAFCGFNKESWSDRRALGFQSFVNDIPQAKFSSFQVDWFAKNQRQRDSEKANLIAWLKSLPKPVGIMGCNDACGKKLIDCCEEASIDVPESIAVLGVDNDELLCNFSHTPLSSVMPNAEEIGFRSAALLSEMLESKSKPTKAQEFKIPPLGVFARRSSDIVAVEDDELSATLQFIRNNACQGITVADVVNEIGVSRSTIERKMRDVIGRSPQQEIRRVQLRQVCTLLLGTDLPIETIALQCGYGHPEYMHVVFKREMKMTPGKYRKTGG